MPTAVTGGVIRCHHREAGHLGGVRLWTEMGRHYLFGDAIFAKRLSERIQGQCEICQSIEPSRIPYKFPIEPHPVPPYLMDSVTVDLFAMPEAVWQGNAYDTIALCVDRESGWIVATPHQDKGLTGRRVAEDMYRQWEMFGIPSRVSSDRGAHFISSWWRTLCAAHGVRLDMVRRTTIERKGRSKERGKKSSESWLNSMPTQELRGLSYSRV